MSLQDWMQEDVTAWGAIKFFGIVAVVGFIGLAAALPKSSVVRGTNAGNQDVSAEWKRIREAERLSGGPRAQGGPPAYRIDDSGALVRGAPVPRDIREAKARQYFAQKEAYDYSQCVLRAQQEGITPKYLCATPSADAQLEMWKAAREAGVIK